MSRMSMRQIEDAFAVLGLAQESERQRLRTLALLGEEDILPCSSVARATDGSSTELKQEGAADAHMA